MKMYGLAVVMGFGVVTAVAGGCCAPMHCGDCGPHELGAPAPCNACGPAGPCEACGPTEHYSPQCVACGVNGPCPKHLGGRGLFGFLTDNATCGAGCGEFYVHPWINDPPHPCDPCDHHGNWVGPRPCGLPPRRVGDCPVGWHNLWGHRGDLGDCCNGHPGHSLHPLAHQGEVIHEGEVLHGPTLAPPQETDVPASPGSNEPNSSDAAPEPPEFPGPATSNGSARTRSALKKIDGRPAVYFGRRPQVTSMR